MARSLKVKPEFISRVKSALQRNGYARQKDIAEDLMVSLATISNFLNGKPVDYFNFQEICNRLGLNWQEITDLSNTEQETEPPGFHFFRGNAYTEAGNYEAAIAAYQIALTVYTRKAFPQNWAIIQNNLGNAYSDRIQGDKAQNIENAIAAYQAALTIVPRNACFQQWAIIQNNLGNAYSDRIIGERSENIEQAIAAYQAAITVCTSDVFPQNWAIIQNNLGNAYCDRIQGDKAQNIENAIAAYRAALEVRTRTAFPLDWAITQNNLGLAFSERIRGDKAENLKVAINYHQATLEVYTYETFPYEWASTCEHLGNIYSEKIHDDSLEDINRLENIEISILFYQDALKIYTPDQFTDECLIVREKLSNAHYLLEYYFIELELASLSQLNTCDEALARIELVRANILDLEVDAIVIPTSPFLDLSGQVGKQLLVSLGSRLSEQLQNQERPSLGEVVVTDGNTLPASYLFFTPVRDEHNITEINIFQGVTAALTKANSLSNVRTIAFPAVGTGAIGFNPAILAPKILKIVTNHLNKENHLEKVIFAFIDETAYQAYASAYQMLLLETEVSYNVSVTIPQETVSLGEDIEISVNLNQVEITQRETYKIQISRNDAIGGEINIILNAPGFQFNNDNTTSLPSNPALLTSRKLQLSILLPCVQVK